MNSSNSRTPLRSRSRSTRAVDPPVLPAWPLTLMFALYPLWWILGFAEMAWIPLAACMVILLARRGGTRLPRGFGIWILFILLMLASAIGVDTSGRMIGFVYRALLYLTVTVVFVYIYNARERLTLRFVLGLITLFWIYTWLGGVIALLIPEFSFDTLLGYLVPQSLQSNELVTEMVTRRFSQYNPDNWLDLDPRPSAPFLYTNTWGNVYSLTLPLVVAYLGVIRRGVRFWLVAVAIPVSFVPAIMTLNRGMLIGLATAGGYLFVRFLLLQRWRAVTGLAIVGVLAIIPMLIFDVADRLLNRVEVSSTTEDRAGLYRETFERTLHSPLFGYGAPRPSESAGVPSVGTQGHVWTVMFSHGFPALFCFLLALIWLIVATARGRNSVELILHAVQLVLLVESFFYGVLPNGLVISFAAAALMLRERAGPAPPRIRDSHGSAQPLPAE